MGPLQVVGANRRVGLVELDRRWDRQVLVVDTIVPDFGERDSSMVSNTHQPVPAR
jgi:hypothetical protein